MAETSGAEIDVYASGEVEMVAEVRTGEEGEEEVG